MSTRTFLATGAAALTVAASALAGPLVGPASAATAPFCGPENLVTAYHATDAGAGHRYGRIVLRNTSDQTCRTHGYGGVAYVDDIGRQIGASATRTPGPDPVLVLKPGQKAVSVLDEAVAQNYPKASCHPRKVTSLQVIGPDWEVGRFVAHRTTGCANTKIHLLAHQPYTRP